MAKRTLVYSHLNMLHLAVDGQFTYLNYLSVMTAIIHNEVTIWIKSAPEGKYWDLIKKMKMITFKDIDPVTGISLDVDDRTGRIDIIYMAPLTDSYVDHALIDHTNMYEIDGEFEINDMCLVRVFKPELITPEYVANSKTAIAELIKILLLERVWNVQ